MMMRCLSLLLLLLLLLLICSSVVHAAPAETTSTTATSAPATEKEAITTTETPTSPSPAEDKKYSTSPEKGKSEATKEPLTTAAPPYSKTEEVKEKKSETTTSSPSKAKKQRGSTAPETTETNKLDNKKESSTTTTTTEPKEKKGETPVTSTISPTPAPKNTEENKKEKFSTTPAPVTEKPSVTKPGRPTEPTPPPRPETMKEKTTTTAAPGSFAHSAVEISAPDIYPEDSEPFVGSVKVHIVANAQHSSIYYTRDGSMPTNRSILFTGLPIQIFTPGTHIIKAFAFSLLPGRGDSAVVTRNYTILESTVPPPISDPPEGEYRGNVTVHLGFSPRMPAAMQSGAHINYAVGTEDPGHSWLLYEHGILLDTGDHILVAMVNSSDHQQSPMATFRYIVSPPLVYDVSSECKGCKGKPTAGESFTIWIQNAKHGAVMCLSMTSNGCCKENRMLDDTHVEIIKNHKVSFKFRTYSEVQRAYVCVDEGDGYTILPHRSGTNYFEIQPAIRAFTRPPETPVPMHHKTDLEENKEEGFEAVIALSVAALIVVAILIKFLRWKSKPSDEQLLRPSQHSQQNSHHSHRRHQVSSSPGASGGGGGGKGQQDVELSAIH